MSSIQCRYDKCALEASDNLTCLFTWFLRNGHSLAGRDFFKNQYSIMLLIFYHIFILLQVSYVPWLVKITAEPAICRKKVMAACRNNTQPNPFMFFFNRITKWQMSRPRCFWRSKDATNQILHAPVSWRLAWWMASGPWTYHWTFFFAGSSPVYTSATTQWID